MDFELKFLNSNYETLTLLISIKVCPKTKQTLYSKGGVLLYSYIYYTTYFPTKQYKIQMQYAKTHILIL